MNSPGDFRNPLISRMSNRTSPKKGSPAKLERSRVLATARKQRKQPATGSRGKIPLNGLSLCAQDYAAALVDPFDGPLTCVPSSFPPIPSWKTRVWAKGTLSTGTQGIGFVMVNPKGLFSNNATGVGISTTAYAQTGFPNSVVDAGVLMLNSNAPYANADIADTPLGVQYRMVAIGVRTWYIDSELSLSGEMYGFRQPDNVSVLGLTSTQLLRFPATRRVAVTSDRATLDVTWIPTKPSELEFQGNSTDGVNSFGIIVVGPAAIASRFAFEVYGIAEYIGSVVPQRTPSHADPAGFAAVLTTVQTQGDSFYGDAREAASRLLAKAGAALRDLSGSKFGQAAARAAVGLTASYFGLPSQAIMPESRVTVTEIDSRTELRELPKTPAPEKSVRSRASTTARYDSWERSQSHAEGSRFPSLADWIHSSDYKAYMAETVPGPDGSL